MPVGSAAADGRGGAAGAMVDENDGEIRLELLGKRPFVVLCASSMREILVGALCTVT